jgi:hypothetical protein
LVSGEPGIGKSRLAETLIFQQIVRGRFCVVEPTGVDRIEDGIGGIGQFIIALVVVPGLVGGREGLTFEGLILVQAAPLVFLATAAGAGFIAADFGHIAVSQ